jgi:hypothetical protein
VEKSLMNFIQGTNLRYLGRSNGNMNLLVDDNVYQLFYELHRGLCGYLIPSEHSNKKSKGVSSNQLLDCVIQTLIDCEQYIRDTRSDPEYELYVTCCQWGGQRPLRFQQSEANGKYNYIRDDVKYVLSFPLGLEFVECLMQECIHGRIHIGMNVGDDSLFLIRSPCAGATVSIQPVGTAFESSINLLEYMSRERASTGNVTALGFDYSDADTHGGTCRMYVDHFDEYLNEERHRAVIARAPPGIKHPRNYLESCFASGGDSPHGFDAGLVHMDVYPGDHVHFFKSRLVDKTSHLPPHQEVVKETKKRDPQESEKYWREAIYSDFQEHLIKQKRLGVRNIRVEASLVFTGDTFVEGGSPIGFIGCALNSLDFALSKYSNCSFAARIDNETLMGANEVLTAFGVNLPNELKDYYSKHMLYNTFGLLEHSQSGQKFISKVRDGIPFGDRIAEMVFAKARALHVCVEPVRNRRQLSLEDLLTRQQIRNEMILKELAKYKLFTFLEGKSEEHMGLLIKEFTFLELEHEMNSHRKTKSRYRDSGSVKYMSGSLNSEPRYSASVRFLNQTVTLLLFMYNVFSNKLLIYCNISTFNSTLFARACTPHVLPRLSCLLLSLTHIPAGL